MTFRKLSALALVPFLSIALIGCDVDAENGEMPTVDVEGGEMPEVDVNGPEVTTGEKDITIPTVGIDVPEEGDNE